MSGAIRGWALAPDSSVNQLIRLGLCSGGIPLQNASMTLKLLAAALGLALFALGASAHPGKTDPYGCHQEEAAGEMHCHDAAGRKLPWPPVKKSRNDICHDRDSQWYAQTIHFEPFNTLKDCLDSGGRLPKD